MSLMSRSENLPEDGEEVEIHLRWSDQDSLGHVNNARVVTLVEEARIRWSGRHGESDLFPHGLVVASMNLDYLRPVYYTSSVMVRVGVQRIGTKSFVVRHIGFQDGAPVFDGSNVMVALAEDKLTPRPLNENERSWLSERLFRTKEAV